MSDDSSNSTGESPGASLVEYIGTPDVVDLAADWLTLPADGMMRLTDTVPVLRTVVGLGRATLGVREYLFARKLLTFFARLETTSAEQRSALVRRLRADDNVDRAGEVLMEVLDKALTSDKAHMLGRLFARCVTDGTSWNDCERMSEMVTAAYLDDLRYFARTDSAEVGQSGDEVEHLLALGF